MKRYIVPVFFFIFSLFSIQIFGQQDDLESLPSHKNERSFTFSLSTTGLGLGGAYRIALPSYMHLGVDLEFFIVRDDKEFEFISPYTGRAFKINDANRLFLIPLNLELKKRLFTDDIEDNFRPHLMFQAGGIFGMNFPNEVFVDGDVVKPDNQYKFTYNFIIGFGVDFTTRANYFATIRPQYRIVYFPTVIAGKTNHSAFEIKFEIGGQL